MSNNNHYNQLWVEKHRPKVLEDVVLSAEVKEHFASLNEDTPHILFYGSPGTGKSTMAKVIVNSILKCQYLYVNASDENGVDTIRNKVISFAQTRSIDGNKKVVILEEADGLTGDSLRILRNVMEEYESTTRFILTANYFNKIIEPIRSRCLLFKLQPDLKEVVIRCINILQAEKISVEENQKAALLSHIEKHYPDLRRIINDLQKFSTTGKLIIKEQHQISDTANYIFQSLINKTSSLDIRAKIIENEKTFNGDYQLLMKELFEIFYATKNVKDSSKKLILCNIGEYMYRDNTVLDHEINFFMCIVSLEDLLK
jgi:DNA polymerase III delta prime subunit